MTKIEFKIIDSLSREWRIAKNDLSEIECKTANELASNNVIGTVIVNGELYYTITLTALNKLKTEKIEEEVIPAKEVKKIVEEKVEVVEKVEPVVEVKVEEPVKKEEPVVEIPKEEVTVKVEEDIVEEVKPAPKKRTSTKKKVETAE